MLERFGARGTEVRGVFFTESTLAGTDLGGVDVKINLQNSNLTAVKERMADEVLRRGGNAVSEFKYGQRARKWWKLGWDDEEWFGSGRALAVP